jgi:hypothetical protein
MVEVAEEPEMKLIGVIAPIVKSWEEGEMNVNVAVAVFCREPLVPVMVTV